MPAFTRGDRHQLADHGIAIEEAEWQVERLLDSPRYVQLVRPCTVGDGIERIPAEAAEGLRSAHLAAASAGRFLKFVPASGAASRMFADLHYFHSGPGSALSWSEISSGARSGGRREELLATLVREIRRFAFHDDLERVLRRSGRALDDLADAGAFQPILEALLGRDGLGSAGLPKGLLEFHRYGGRGRTAFEEHLVEAAGYVRDAAGLCRLHLTVSPEGRSRFEQLLHDVEVEHGRRCAARFEVGYSYQKPATDTVSVDSAGRLVRDEARRLRLRPGGHGSLLENLGELRCDLVFIKNIDNVQPDRTKALAIEWKCLLAGRLLELERCAGLARPIRVCGVVPNTGEPGGGPFWVRGADGAVSVQIVESAQVDPADEGQQTLWRSSTHFNPVDLVCALRDPNGEPHDLRRFVDRDAVIVSAKREAGREIRVLERPGLWNGAMAGWNTALVEVPLLTFSPVKTVLDLLRPEHQEQD